MKSQAEIDVFQAEHFSNAAVELFASDFLQPQGSYEEEEYHGDYYEEYEEYYEEDDGLGYYPDGVKRTLTDEQIAIFRHSELEALKRAEDRTSKNNEENTPVPSKANSSDTAGPPASDEEVQSESDTSKLHPPKTASASKKKKRRKGKNKSKNAANEPQNPQKGEAGWFKKTIKPDLRKRTWDVVEAGMDSLDYDGVEASGNADGGSAAQRRKISYDD
jgi:hypothetical protein